MTYSCVYSVLCWQECQDCLQQVLDLYLWDAADKPPEVQSAAFEAACMKAVAAFGDKEAVSMCQGMAAGIFKDPTLGNRAGRLCMSFGSCWSLSSNCSISVAARNGTVQTGTFTTCTISGVAGAKGAANVTSAGEGLVQTGHNCKTSAVLCGGFICRLGTASDEFQRQHCHTLQPVSATPVPVHLG